ncbi:SOS-response transcriptional repressor, LexA [Dethiosulfatibacter aminovorans DSM 17477]|uniref:LexA repressor n=1 Tax=Dethiosulfatibacter aminovorans DSM 17477 TaxID=1121476 RepID=A0A1M6DCA2_9FIRM|nr:transcriptional repressor LexA [Dethiosulfatibacter aminovorans]SHI70755.1 SOS-response transcriptional repressor, LexA [Dethiosulfatibacter aminovorans DSM 17477]
MKDLSNKQITILNYIKKEISDNGYPPSVREICKAVGLKSTSTVHSHLNTLVKKGYIRKGDNKNRAIEVIDTEDAFVDIPKKEVTNVPLVGRIAAGEPILAVENVDDLFPIPVDWVGKNETFVLRVKGDSMIDAGILDGDYVVISSQNTARNGDIVAALLDDETTLKRFYKEKDHFRLQPENSTMEPIIVKDVNILGILKCVIRRY